MVSDYRSGGSLIGGGGSIGFVFPGLICCWVLMFMWVNNKDKDDTYIDPTNVVKIPSSIAGYEGKHYSAIESMFLSAGFTNVKCVPLHDLTIGLLKKPGMVASITVNGQSITSGGKKCSPDANVVISYHSHR